MACVKQRARSHARHRCGQSVIAGPCLHTVAPGPSEAHPWFLKCIAFAHPAPVCESRATQTGKGEGAAWSVTGGAHRRPKQKRAGRFSDVCRISFPASWLLSQPAAVVPGTSISQHSALKAVAPRFPGLEPVWAKSASAPPNNYCKFIVDSVRRTVQGLPTVHIHQRRLTLSQAAQAPMGM